LAVFVVMCTPIRLIIGLGNPGLEYEATRHNAGFWLIERIAADLHSQFSLEKSFCGLLAKTRQNGEHVALFKPLTYMNRSGRAVGALVHFYKFKPAQILVLHDELDLMPGQVKLKQGGGHAGHNGVRDLQAVLGSPEFWRLRIGIGHPRTLGLAQQSVADFVLHPPRADEQVKLERAMENCRALIPQFLAGDFKQAMQQLHRDNGS
jgi:PTH1 family peptidyl-tRNA hydrolase